MSVEEIDSGEGLEIQTSKRRRVSRGLKDGGK